MSRKTILEKTKMFICIVACIILFQAIFGPENTLIGVTVVTATLMFLERDLTTNKLNYLLVFLAVNLTQGISAYIAQENIILGSILTFICIFVSGYLFTHDLKAPMYIAFGLQYVFILYVPITIDRLPIRLLALASGAFIIVGYQLIFNRRRLKKITDGIFPGVILSLNEKINKIINLEYAEENSEDLDKSIVSRIKTVKKAAFDSKHSNFHTALEAKIMLNVSIALERFSILLTRVSMDLKDEKSIDKNDKEFLLFIKECFNGLVDTQNNKEKLIKEIDKIRKTINIYKKENNIKVSKISSENLREIIENLDFLEHNLREAAYANPKEYRKIIRKTSIPDNFKTRYTLFKDFNINSLKFSYAFRCALLITIGYFVVKYFNIQDGKWLVYTLLSIIQPYYQDAKLKSVNRMKGTLIGVLVFMVLFSIVTNSTGRSMMVLMAGYLGSYMKTYDRQMIFTTISALGVAAAVGEPIELSLIRILLVTIGVVIGFAANKFILPYNIQDSSKKLMKMYDGIFEEIDNQIDLASKGQGNIQYMRNLVMQVSLIEDRLYRNAAIESKESKEKIEEIIENNRIKVNDLYDEYLGVHSKNKK